ncbi:MAG: hypothetical protein R6X08_01500 [Desulfosalsimonadaceae bacterium]
MKPVTSLLLTLALIFSVPAAGFGCVQFNFKPSQVSPCPVIDLMSTIERKGKWEEISLTSTAPSGARALTLKILLTKGTVWIDDVSITPVPDQ